MSRPDYEPELSLKREQYLELLELLSPLPTRTLVRTDYYYDSPDRWFRSRQIALCVRESGGRLTGIVRRPGPTGQGCRVTDFPVTALPPALLLHGRPAWLVGSLQTRRTIFALTDAILIQLDENRWLGTRNYALKINCPRHSLPTVRGVLLLLQRLLALSALPEEKTLEDPA